jgi:polysaccharide biosynthesis protein PelG
VAGIGWKLQRMIDRGSLAGTVGAYLTGVAITSAPWLLTTAVLTSLRVTARHHGGNFSAVEQLLTVIYALTVVLSAPVHVVVSRYTADRLYDHHVEKIAAPLRRALALTVAGFAGVGLLVVLLMRLTLSLAIVGAPLTAVIGAQWLMLSVGGGMSSPGVVLRAFGAGAPLSMAAALALDYGAHLGAAGYLYGFAAGQLATLAILIRGVARAIPGEADETARLAPAFREYRLLAASAFVYYLSIWADKVVVYLVTGRTAAAQYAAVAALAWFSVIPAFAWIYVQIETAFYQRFRAFYGDLERGAPLRQLRAAAGAIADEAARILRGAAIVQTAASGVALAGAPYVIRMAGLSPDALVPFRLAVVGAALQVVTLLEVLLLYYFDLRRDALLISLALLGSEVVLVFAAHLASWPPGLGYAAACALACTAGLILVRRRLATLLVDTFQSQPFGAA